MKNRFGPSLYFASDKVIFDSLNQHQVKIEHVRELLFERGIIVSSRTSKEELAQYFSRLTADYFDHDSIASKLGRVAKKERTTTSELKGSFGDSEILDALNAVKTMIEKTGNTVDITVKDGKIIALISYEHVDYSKIDLRQVEPRDALIVFNKEPDGTFTLRSTQNNEIDAVVDIVVSSLGEKAGKPLERTRISLESMANPASRTNFYENLINDIQGFKFITVTEAYCFRPKTSGVIRDDQDIDTDVDIEKLPWVEKIALRGEGVNKSIVINDLYKSGYYIVKVLWRVQDEKNSNSDIFELEAQFSRPDNCTDFSYKVKSVLMVTDGIQTTKRRSAKKEEEETLFRLIDESAKRSLLSLVQ